MRRFIYKCRNLFSILGSVLAHSFLLIISFGMITLPSQFEGAAINPEKIRPSFYEVDRVFSEIESEIAQAGQSAPSPSAEIQQPRGLGNLRQRLLQSYRTENASANLSAIAPPSPTPHDKTDLHLSADVSQDLNLGREMIDKGTSRLQVEGGMDPQIVEDYVRGRLHELRYCYERLLLREPNAEGRLATQWSIRSDGQVVQVRLNSDELSNTEFQECVGNRISQWKFNEPPKGGSRVQVHYPFLFNPLTAMKDET